MSAKTGSASTLPTPSVMYEVTWMPWLCANAATLRFCRYGCSSIWLVAICAAPTVSMASRSKATVKFETPSARVSPSRLASSSAPRYSAIGTAPPGDGQWISVRSTCSVRSLARLALRLGISRSAARLSTQILVVRNRSRRGTPDAAITWPTSASFA